MNKEINWEHHWDKMNKNFFGSFCHFYRKRVIAPAVKYYFDKYMPNKGLFVEAGCGTGESSTNIKINDRRLIALDFAFNILSLTKKNPSNFKYFVCTNIKNLPFKKKSIDGIWNLGVIEHFEKNEMQIILNEFHRILKPRARLLIFWPPIFGSTNILLYPIELCYNLLSRKNFSFFPEEKTKFTSKKSIKQLLSKTKFKEYNFHFSYRDFFTHMIVVCKK